MTDIFVFYWNIVRLTTTKSYLSPMNYNMLTHLLYLHVNTLSNWPFLLLDSNTGLLIIFPCLYSVMFIFMYLHDFTYVAILYLTLFIPPACCHLFCGGGIAYLKDPDSYAGWSYTPGRAS